jgi:hypothetical protein
VVDAIFGFVTSFFSYSFVRKEPALIQFIAGFPIFGVLFFVWFARERQSPRLGSEQFSHP